MEVKTADEAKMDMIRELGEEKTNEILSTDINKELYKDA